VSRLASSPLRSAATVGFGAAEGARYKTIHYLIGGKISGRALRKVDPRGSATLYLSGTLNRRLARALSHRANYTDGHWPGPGLLVEGQRLDFVLSVPHRWLLILVLIRVSFHAPSRYQAEAAQHRPQRWQRPPHPPHSGRSSWFLRPTNCPDLALLIGFSAPFRYVCRPLALSEGADSVAVPQPSGGLRNLVISEDHVQSYPASVFNQLAASRRHDRTGSAFQRELLPT